MIDDLTIEAYSHVLVAKVISLIMNKVYWVGPYYFHVLFKQLLSNSGYKKLKVTG